MRAAYRAYKFGRAGMKRYRQVVLSRKRYDAAYLVFQPPFQQNGDCRWRNAGDTRCWPIDAGL